LEHYLRNYELEPGATCLGRFKLTSGAPVRVFLFEEKPYIHMPGVGDVQMFPTVRRDIFAVWAVLSMGIAFQRGASDEVTAVTLTLGDDTLSASRVHRQRTSETRGSAES
jgi:hypothetical protein